MHTIQILWLFSLPVTIFLSYLAVVWVVKKYEKSIAKHSNGESDV